MPVGQWMKKMNPISKKLCASLGVSAFLLLALMFGDEFTARAPNAGPERNELPVKNAPAREVGAHGKTKVTTSPFETDDLNLLMQRLEEAGFPLAIRQRIIRD